MVPLTICDLTQSWSPTAGGGVSTYLRQKRDHVLANTPHRLIQIVPGPEDRLTVDGRHVLAEVEASPVRGSPHYRFILRGDAVRRLLADFRPDVIESQCPWILPWQAIRHRRAYPQTALVAGYHTDFPNTQVHAVANNLFGAGIASMFRWLSWGYAEITYREFDHVYALSEEACAALRRRKIAQTSLLPLGVDTTLFDPARRDPAYRTRIGLPGDGPLLVYAGRIDNERRADRLIALMRCLPPELGAGLVMIGDGKLRDACETAAADLPVVFTGFERDREVLAEALASSDVYVTAMADETFGLAVLEAQAAGLPVVGVDAGAMRDRVVPGTGLLGPVDDPAAMAANVVRIWSGDRAAMSDAARAHATAQFDWRRTFDSLLDEVYVAALARAKARIDAPRRVLGGWRTRDVAHGL